MKTSYALLIVLLLALSTSGCYHAVVVTGKPMSDTVVEEQWLLGFVGGLIIPDEISVEEECPNGVAMVETELSFLNQLATFLTGGIFSPMSVRVTCAAGGMGMMQQTPSAVPQTLTEAAVRSLNEQAPVYVQLAPAK